MNLRLETVVPAPPDRVLAAFADAQQLLHWWGPTGFTVQSLRFDPAEDTDYRIAMKPPEGDVFHIRGRFLAVEVPRRLAYTFVYEEPGPDDQETMVTLTFEQSGSGTSLVLDQGSFKTTERVRLHRDGWSETLERLDRYLT